VNVDVMVIMMMMMMMMMVMVTMMMVIWDWSRFPNDCSQIGHHFFFIPILIDKRRYCTS